MDINQLELQILKSILSNKRNAIEFINEGNEKLFSSDLWKFVRLVSEYIKTYKEVPTKRVILERIKSSKNDALNAYISEIFDKAEGAVYDDREYKHDIDKLKNKFADRLIVDLKNQLNNHSGDLKKTVAEIQSALGNIKSVNQPKAYKQGSLVDYAEEFKSTYAAKLKNPEQFAGIKTGYSFIDYAISGMQKSELFCVAGQTASGKSMLLMNMGLQMWMGENNLDTIDNFRKGCNVLLFSLEMSYFDYFDRVLSRLSFVPQYNIRDAKLTDEEKNKIGKAFKFIKRYPYSFSVVDLPRKATVHSIEMIIDEYTSKGLKPDVVIIDYMNLMDANMPKETSDWLAQSFIAEQTHELCRSQNVIVCSALQLNPRGSGGEKEETGLGIKSIRRATQIVDNLSFLAVINTRKNEKMYPEMSIELVKNRRGELTKGSLVKNLSCCAILDKKIEDNIDNEDISNKLEN